MLSCCPATAVKFFEKNLWWSAIFSKFSCNTIHVTLSDLQLCQKETPMQVLSCENCKIFKNTFFNRTLCYSDCFCVFWKSGENFSLQQLGKFHVGRQQLYWELYCRHSRGNFSKLIKQYPQLLLLLSSALKFWTILYLCSIVDNDSINNAVIL